MVAVEDNQHQANRTEDDAPRRMSVPEREARKDRLRRLLAPCIVIGGIIDPADVVINKFLQMAEENTPRWVVWECAPGRSPKLAAEPRGKKKWLPEAKGQRSLPKEPTADVSGQLQIDFALKRQGLAAELAGVMTFESHDKLRQAPINAMTEDPPDSGYARASLEHFERLTCSCGRS